MGNGAKAAQKREKNQANQKKGPTSQLAAAYGKPSSWTWEIPVGQSIRNFADDAPSDFPWVSWASCGQNAKAMTLVCTVCKSPFMSTSRAPALTEHAANKHSKDLATCFPDFKG
ncbi:hypothetical protein JCM21900_006132 [Sporobolomyces salmonicolor]